MSHVTATDIASIKTIFASPQDQQNAEIQAVFTKKQNDLTVAEVEISKANILAMNGTPVVVIPAIAGSVLEFVSACLIYDRATETYGGGGDVSIGYSGGAKLSSTIAKANCFGASGDKVYNLQALNADGGVSMLVNTGIVITNATGAFTDPKKKEKTTFQFTVAEDTGGDVEITLNGVVHTIPITAGAVAVNAAEVNAYINTTTTHTSTVLNDTVTVTAVDYGVQTDASFDKGTANSSACTVVVTQQGVNTAEGVGRLKIAYRIHETGL